MIKEKLIYGKGKKTITKNGKNKIIYENKLLSDITLSQRLPIHNIFNDFYNIFNFLKIELQIYLINLSIIK